MVASKRAGARFTTTLVALALALATSGSAQTFPPTDRPARGAREDVAKNHLTAARNTLSDVTQLPAAAQLVGNPRRLVQELITDFNMLIAAGSDWRAPYGKVASTLDDLLEPSSPVSGTAGAVGTSGPSSGIDPAIRAKLVEFRAHLGQFEAVAGGDAAASSSAAPKASPQSVDPAVETPVPAAAQNDRPGSPPPPAPAAADAQEVTVVARDLLLHVEAVEVILGAQTAAQKSATAAAGGALVTSETASGSTKTTITGPNVTLNAEQLAQVRNHLKEIRRLLERK